jgi:protein tyrosine phosphatase (PTP) superfamily phosphohydrolase (DUF442 family)
MLRTWHVLGLTLIAGAQIASASVDGPTTTPAVTPAASTAAVTSPAAAPAAGTVAAVTAKPESLYRQCADPTHRLIVKGVPNFGKLNDFIWRSGQPTGEGYSALAKQGLKTVVNLREEFPQDKDLVPKGVKYVYIPITDQHAPTQEQAKQFMEVASNPDNWPLLVHCHGGEGRAGVMSALVRRTLDGWDGDKALKEAGNFRVKHLGLFTIRMVSCQRKFIEDWAAAAAAKPQSN